MDLKPILTVAAASLALALAGCASPAPTAAPTATANQSAEPTPAASPTPSAELPDGWTEVGGNPLPGYLTFNWVGDSFLVTGHVSETDYEQARYYPDSGDWVELPSPPGPIQDFGVSSLRDGSWYEVVRVSGNQWAIYMLDLADNTWTTMDMPRVANPEALTGVLADDEYLYAYNGCSFYEQVGGDWVALPEPPHEVDDNCWAMLMPDSVGSSNHLMAHVVGESQEGQPWYNGDDGFWTKVPAEPDVFWVDYVTSTGDYAIRGVDFDDENPVFWFGGEIVPELGIRAQNTRQREGTPAGPVTVDDLDDSYYVVGVEDGRYLKIEKPWAQGWTYGVGGDTLLVGMDDKLVRYDFR
ncbi:MAG: hypothetical protein LBR58_11360 [Propionibacteriaceae bacterium]|nr:hypothetical protein [Propionibacteriaceae bacterium]